MSRRGNCYDYAQAESFWSRPKTELLDGGRFPGLEEARLEPAYYIPYYKTKEGTRRLITSYPTASKPYFK